MIVSMVGYFSFNPVIFPNGKSSMDTPQDIYLVAEHDSQHNFVFVKKEATSKTDNTVDVNPEIKIKKGQLVAIHYISKDTDSKHDLNVDEFNVHTQDLWYFETYTSTFLADKTGTFRYYCSLHPEMAGNIIVE